MEATERKTGDIGHIPDLPDINLERVIGFDVIDRNNQDIGNVSAFWTDHRGRPAFIGVRAFWLVGKTHVVPAYGAEVNPTGKRVRVPFTNEEVKGAPNYDPDAELDEAKEREVIEYYRAKGGKFPYAEWEKERAGTPPEARAETHPERTGPAETRIPLHEEALKVGKRTVEMGGIRLRKIVRTETVEHPVELKREDVVVERVPAGERGREGRPAEGKEGKVFEGEEIFIPLCREEPVVEKETRVREEFRARKTEERESQTVSGEVRKEDVQVQDQRKEETKGVPDPRQERRK